MNPSTAYRQLNKLLWQGRLPNAMVEFIEDERMPRNYGITLWDSDFALPIIFINASHKRWMRVLIHEMCHVSDPSLPHGKNFNALVETYWRMARRNIRGLK